MALGFCTSTPCVVLEPLPSPCPKTQATTKWLLGSAHGLCRSKTTLEGSSCKTYLFGISLQKKDLKQEFKGYKGRTPGSYFVPSELLPRPRPKTQATTCGGSWVLHVICADHRDSSGVDSVKQQKNTIKTAFSSGVFERSSNKS